MTTQDPNPKPPEVGEGKQALLNANHVIAAHRPVAMKLLSATPDVWVDACPYCQIPFPCLPVILARALLAAVAERDKLQRRAEKADECIVEFEHATGGLQQAIRMQEDLASLRSDLARVEVENAHLRGELAAVYERYDAARDERDSLAGKVEEMRWTGGRSRWR